ncbi:MAG: DNA repair protein RecN [Candidatus Edwardsbacteria bacterium]|jgi:DNA repair protein RecN (Recombination protein N)|nr:DNA repair protein RecN [Candidatus Edwardsbacteria bacterium]
MLTKLTVRDYALIEALEVDFEPGLNILTGETGAGKSILVGALGLVLGERADSDSVRGGAKAAVVEAEFDVAGRPALAAKLRELEVEHAADPLIARREVQAGGKSRAFLADGPVPLAALKSFGDLALDMHGQHQHQSLLYEERHVDYLDGFGRLLALRRSVAESYSRYQATARRLDDLVNKEQLTREKLDLYQYQVKEIEAAALRQDEEEELDRERTVLGNAEKLSTLASQAYGLLYEGEGAVSEQLGALGKALADIRAIDGRIDGLAAAVGGASAQLDEAARELRRYRDGITFDPGRLADIRDRLDLVRTLRKKYGGRENSVAAVLAHLDRIKREIDSVEHGEELIAGLKRQLEGDRARLEAGAIELSAKRTQAAQTMARAVEAELADLGMEKARFAVEVAQQEEADGPVRIAGKAVSAGATGIDRVRFLISPNPGEEPKALARIASGGEISRVMLAIKSILAEADAVPVLVFDEIDAGIGGRVAEAVGRKLKAIAAGRQVLCITHLPQIAAQAGAHYRVSKATAKGRTVTTVRRLDDGQRIEEIARMLAGSAVTETALRHAREMVAAGAAPAGRR